MRRRAATRWPLLLAAPPAQAQDPEVALALLGAQPARRAGVHGQRRAARAAPPTPGARLELLRAARAVPRQLAVVQTATSGAVGEFAFTVTPVRKAYWAVVAPATPTRPRVASRGHLVALRRQVSIRTSTRRPRTGAPRALLGLRLARLPGRAGHAWPRSSARPPGGSLGRRARRAAARAGAFSSYRMRTRVRRSGEYRVVVPPTTFFSRGASVDDHACACAAADPSRPDGRVGAQVTRRHAPITASDVAPSSRPSSRSWARRRSCPAPCSRPSARPTVAVGGTQHFARRVRRRGLRGRGLRRPDARRRCAAATAAPRCSAPPSRR